MSNDKKTYWEAFHITETNMTKKNSDEPVFDWNRVGVAFDNSDGSLSVVLHSLPVDGKLHLRRPKERTDS